MEKKLNDMVLEIIKSISGLFVAFIIVLALFTAYDGAYGTTSYSGNEFNITTK